MRISPTWSARLGLAAMNGLIGVHIESSSEVHPSQCGAAAGSVTPALQVGLVVAGDAGAQVRLEADAVDRSPGYSYNREKASEISWPAIWLFSSTGENFCYRTVAVRQGFKVA
jgi:hypothetical protein